MTCNIFHQKNGQSILEVIIAIAIFGLIAAAMMSMVTGSFTGLTQGGQQTEAEALAEEGIEAVRAIRDNAWNALTFGTTSLQIIGNAWNFTSEGTSETIGIFTRTIRFDSVCRNGSNAIVACSSGTVDIESKKVTVRVSWEVRPGVTNTVERSQYLTNWDSRDVIDTTKANFEAGSFNGTFASSTNDFRLLEANLFKTVSVQKTIQLSGSDDASDLFIDEYNDALYLVTDTDASNPEFFAYDISNMSSSTASSTLLGSTEIGNDVKGVYVYNGYAFLATSNVNEQLVIIRLADFAKVGTWTSSNGKGGLSVSGTTTKLFLGTENNSSGSEWYALDIASPSAPGLLQNLDIGGNVYAIAVAQNKAYVASDNTSAELTSIDVSTYATQSANADGTATGFSVAATANEVYLGKGGSSGSAEFFAYDTNLLPQWNAEVGDSILGISVYDGYAYLATNDTGRELQVIQLSDHTLYGEGDANGSNPCNRVVFYTMYAYLACRDNTDEIQVMKSSIISGWATPKKYGDGSTSDTEDGYAITIAGNYVVIGTENNSGGPELYSFLITSTASGLVPVSSLEIGGDVNDIVESLGHLYLATGNDSKELIDVTINIMNGSLAESQSYNADESTDARTVYLSGSYVYLGTGNNTGSNGSCDDDELYVINKTSMSCVGSYDAGFALNDIVISGNLLYAATPSNSAEVKVYNIVNPASITDAGSYDASGSNDGLGLSLDGNDLYLSRVDDGSNSNIYILNISGGSSITKTGEMRVVGDSYRTSVYSGNYLFVANSENTKEMKVVDIRTKSAPTLLSSFDAGGTVRDVIYNSTNDYAYLSTASNSLGLQIVGPWAARTAKIGTFTSQVFDVGELSALQILSWTQASPYCVTTCPYRMLFRSSPTSTIALQTAEWAGPDGLDSDKTDYFTSEKTLIHKTHNKHRYFQYKAIMEGDGATSATIQDVTINVK